MSEFIYILENPSMPGLVKIGKTDRRTSKRASELSAHTGIPTEFIVVKEFSVEDATAAELEIHERLSEYRVSGKREFFRLSSEDAVLIIENLLSERIASTARNFEREDELVARATRIAIALGAVHAGALAGYLKMPHEEAELLIQALRGRGIIDEQNVLCSSLRAEHESWARKRDKLVKIGARLDHIRARRHDLQIRSVRELLRDLVDPESGEPAEVGFDRDGEDLVVEIRGSTWVTAEAQRRLAHLSSADLGPGQDNPSRVLGDDGAVRKEQ